MDNFLVLGVVAVLALYFYSSMNIYKAMYRRIIEEKEMSDNTVVSLEEMIKRYENQIKSSISAISDSQNNLVTARDDVQRVKLENNDLSHKNKLLQERVNELYTSVGMV